MANAKAKSGRRSPGHAKQHRGTQATLTTAFMVDAGPVPEGTAGFTFKAPSKAAQVLAGKPATIKPLLQRYGEAVARSREAGRPVSFRVEVDPSGSATVTPVDDSAPEIPPIEDAGEQDPRLTRALEAARERGRLRAAEVLGSDDMLSAEDFAEVLGTTRVTVNTKRRNGQLLGLDGAKRGFRFPVWQLDAEGKPYAELPALQERLGGPWALYRFLVQPHGALGGLTGREALERGMAQDALAVAESIGRGDFR